MRPLPLLALAACGTPSQDLGGAFDACNPAEIRHLAEEHGFSLAFEACAGKDLEAFAWSPSGTHLYFELDDGGYVLDAGPSKRIIPLPVKPVGRATWTSPTRLVVPVDHPALVVIDLDGAAAHAMFAHDLDGWDAPDDLQRGRDAGEVLLLATRSGVRDVLRLDLDDGTVEPAFPWTASLQAPIATFTYAPAQDAVVLGVGGGVSLRTSAGEVLETWTPATRGALHPGGRWLALEHDGAPISVFDQRTWDEPGDVPEADAERVDRFARRVGEGVPVEVVPPMLSIVDRTTGLRWRLDDVQGADFQWYEATDGWAGLLLWGFEGKQLRRNVLLGDLGARLVAIGDGRELHGLALWTSTGPLRITDTTR